jgi:preprotein translocase subunit YajC
MRENLQIGDEVTTVGGIVGIVVRKAEDTVVIETGGDRSKIRVKTWAVSENATIHDEAEG